MGKITLEQAKEAFKNADRSERGKNIDKLYAKHGKYLLGVDDERGTLYLTVNGTRRYDFEGVDNATLKTKKRQKEILERAKAILASGKKKNNETGESVKSYVEGVRDRIKDRSRRIEDAKKYLTYITKDNWKEYTVKEREQAVSYYQTLGRYLIRKEITKENFNSVVKDFPPLLVRYLRKNALEKYSELLA